MKLNETRSSFGVYLTGPVIGLLARTPLTPDMLTLLGFLLTVGASLLVVTGHFFAAGLIVLFAGFFDMLDGGLARRTNRVTRFGAVLDSTVDRLAEAVLLISLLIVYTRERAVAANLLVGVALLSSFMVSYVRARAEALGIDCKVGLFTRPERVVILALGLLLSRIDYALLAALAIVALLSLITFVQRLVHVWNRTRAKPAE